MACSAPAPLPVALDTPGLLAVMGRERVVRIGHAYLQSTPSEHTPEQVREAIMNDLVPWPWSTPIAVERRVLDDFAQGRTVVADGWILSVTEARQCALVSLAAG